MRAALSLILLLFFAAPLFPQQRSITYSGIPWGTSRKDVTKKLEKNGITVSAVRETGELEFEQKVTGGFMQGLAKFDNTGLIAINLAYFPAKGQAFKFFENLTRSYTNQFGEPTHAVRDFQKPFTDGDEEAIRAGKATVIAGWLPAAGAKGNRLRVAIAAQGPQIAVGALFSKD
jgi:hypothetical protein